MGQLGLKLYPMKLWTNNLKTETNFLIITEADNGVLHECILKDIWTENSVPLF